MNPSMPAAQSLDPAALGGDPGVLATPGLNQSRTAALGLDPNVLAARGHPGEQLVLQVVALTATCAMERVC
jgi:hypothetical protein